MTGDARGEAERVVDGFVQAICDLSDGNAVLPEAEENDRDALVAALAAAIEETDAEDAVERLRNSPRRHGKGAATTRLSNARAARRDALSALRARAGEEAG